MAQLTATSLPRSSNPVGRARAERRFFTGASALMLVASVVGFMPTFYARGWFPERQHYVPPEPFFAWHGAICTVWLVLVFVQPWLVQRRRLRLHRNLGMVSVLVAMGVAGTSVYGALLAGIRPGGFMGPPLEPEVFLLVPFLDAGFFALLVGAGVVWRRSPAVHKRLMLLGSLSMCQAAFVRIQPAGPWSGPVVQFGLTLAFVVAMARFDRRQLGRVHPVTAWLGLPLFVSEFLRFPIAMTDAWRWVGRALLAWMAG